MIHPLDLQNFLQITGQQAMPEGFEAEYQLWLRMQHRIKQEGPLGILMVPLCRQFNLSPPDDLVLEGGQINWGKIQKGQRVRIKAENGGILVGEFQKRGNHNTVEVKVDGTEWVHEFPPFRVMLDDSIPSDIKLPQAVKDEVTRPQAPPAGFTPPFATTEETFKPFDPSGHLTQVRTSRPKMQDAAWYDVVEGATVLVEREEGPVEAKFLRLGPGPGQLIAEIDGEDELVDETYTTVAPAAPVKQPKKAPAKRRTAKRKTKAAASE